MKDLPVPLPTLMVNGVAEVPCGTCRLCCTAFFVFLDDDEYANYKWGNCIKDGQNMGRVLQRKPNGECIYLTEKGCGIHGQAPRRCREFDCRHLYRHSDRGWRRQAVKGGFPQAILDRGRELSPQRLAYVSKAFGEKPPWD